MEKVTTFLLYLTFALWNLVDQFSLWSASPLLRSNQAKTMIASILDSGIEYKRISVIDLPIFQMVGRIAGDGCIWRQMVEGSGGIISLANLIYRKRQKIQYMTAHVRIGALGRSTGYPIGNIVEPVRSSRIRHCRRKALSWR